MAQACQDQAGSALRRSDIARSWMKDRPDSVVMWMRHSTFDPYEKGHAYPADEGNPEYLELAQNGIFHEHDSVNQSFGQWFINSVDSSLSLRYEIRNGQLITPDVAPRSGRHVYVLRKMSSDSLILETQGRHGMLVITYVPVNHTPSE